MKVYRQVCLIVSATLAMSLFASVLAQEDGWQKTPYQEWTLRDTEKLLTDSPWAQTRSKGIGLTGASGDQPSVNLSVDPEAVTLRLRSALPVRQALLRMRQIKAKYDRMSASEKAAFDSKNKPLVECPACADNYVITLSPAPGSRRGVPVSLKTVPLAKLKLFVQVTDESGARRELVHFVPPNTQGEDAVFFFSQFDDRGAPLISPSSKKLIVTFDQQVITTNSSMGLMKFEFDVSRMVLDGEVAL